MASPPRPIPTITLSSEAGYGAVFGTLGVVTLLTLGFFALQSSKKLVEIAGKSVEAAKETYLSARNSQGAVSLTLSYFVSGLGAWVIFAAPEAAVIGGSFALAGYALSTAFPLLLFGLIAPAMRKNVPHGFTQNEYVVSRFGPYVAGVWACVSMFYMFLYLVAELASAGTLASQLSLIPIMEKTFWEGDNVFAPMPLGPILGVSLITLVYTAIGGLPVSILTDRVQGAGILPLVAIIVIGAYAMAGGGDSSRFAEVAGHGVHPLYPDTDYGNSIAIAISLMLGVTCATPTAILGRACAPRPLPY
jgi:solute:Na+ symporter, SSS family